MKVGDREKETITKFKQLSGGTFFVHSNIIYMKFIVSYYRLAHSFDDKPILEEINAVAIAEIGGRTSGFGIAFSPDTKVAVYPEPTIYLKG